MRMIRHRQLPLAPVTGRHDHAKELDAMGILLDGSPVVEDLAARDLLGDAAPGLGRPGMAADQVVRAAIVKQMNGYSYVELAFHLEDSAGYRRFARVALGRAPSASTLQRNIARLTAQTWEAISRVLVAKAVEAGFERGDRIRADCTVVKSNIHHPMDSSLLWDVVRACARLLGRIRARGVHVVFTNHWRRAKRRVVEIRNARGKERRKVLYRDLIRAAADMLRALREALRTLEEEGRVGSCALIARAERLVEQGQRVVDQATRRILGGESVPAAEKTVSLSEPHTDIIIKDCRDVLYGHKVCLTEGTSGLVIDAAVERGNPPDAKMVERTLDRATELLGRVPRQVAFDGGFASRANLVAAKARGVVDVCFSKGRGLAMAEMVRSAWVFRRLRNFRAGIEGTISFLKRSFGLDRCTWRTLARFHAYVWASIASHNLVVLARHLLA